MIQKTINTEKVLMSRKNELLRIICETEHKQKEIGSAICARNNEILPFEWNVGTEKSLQLKKCDRNSKEIGKIHSHPSQWLPDLSLIDKVTTISDNNDLTVLLSKETGEKGWYNADVYNINKKDEKYEKLKNAADTIKKNKSKDSSSDYKIVDRLFDYVADKKHLFSVPPIL